jgi:F-type H+-transporting ATPase subunit gamma
MASLRDIRTRIGSVKSTRQITNAMKLVSAAKLRRATEAATSAKPYQEMLTATLRRVAAAAGEMDDQPLLAQRAEVKKVLLVVLGTDRGLCGGFNGTLNRRTIDWLDERRREGKAVTIWTYGKKPRDFFKNRGIPVAKVTIEVTSAKFGTTVQELGAALVAGFLAEDFDEVFVAYNLFKSTMTQIPTFGKILPLAIGAGSDEPSSSIDYKYEPSAEEILAGMLPLYLRTLLLQSFLETEAGEYAARMAAMDAATRNANDLIKSLTLEYNRGRQAAITKELIEIVSGAEAL